MSVVGVMLSAAETDAVQLERETRAVRFTGLVTDSTREEFSCPATFGVVQIGDWCLPMR